MRPYTPERPTLFLTFAEDDLTLVQPFAAQLSQGGSLILDYGVASERLAAVTPGIVQASLAQRLRRCLAVMCLFSEGTLEDAWVQWTLEAAARLGKPLLGARLADEAWDTEDLLGYLGVKLLPLQVEAIRRQLPSCAGASRFERPSPSALLLALQSLRHPLR